MTLDPTIEARVRAWRALPITQGHLDELALLDEVERLRERLILERNDHQTTNVMLVRASHRAEKAEVALHIQREQPLEVITSIETVRRAHEVTMKERDTTIADNAWLRAALECIVHREDDEPAPWETAQAALARPDLGAGMVAVPREMVERVRVAVDDALAHHQGGHSRIGKALRAAVADLDALLGKEKP